MLVVIIVSTEIHYILMWLFSGLATIGVQTALLNFNLRSKSLLHCITVSEAKALIVGKGNTRQLTKLYI